MAELEKKIDALTAVLQAQQSGAAAPNPYHQPPPTASTNVYQSDPPIQQQQQQQQLPSYPTQQYDSFSTPDTQRVKRRRLDTATDARPERESFNPVKTEVSYNSHVDERHIAVMHGQQRDLHRDHTDALRQRVKELVEPELSNKIVDYYCTKLAPLMPAVVFPPGTTADSLLETKPVLLLAILSAGSTFQASASVREAISEELISCIADCLIAKGIKSLELIQA